MNRFRRFDVRYFLTDSLTWDDKISKWKKELEDMGDLKAVANSEIRTADPSNPTSLDAIRRIELEERIHRYQGYKTALKDALGTLNEGCFEAVEGYFFGDGTFISSACEKSGKSPKYYYRLVDKGLKQITDYINTVYY